MAARTAVAVFLLLALSVCVLAQQEELSLLELTRGFKGTTVKPSSYDGYSVVQTCLEQSQLRNCAVKGDICELATFDTSSPPPCLDGPSGAYWETDLTCCGDKHDYGYGPKTTLGETTINGRAATCSWEIDALKDFSPADVTDNPQNYICVQDDPTSPHCKVGPVTGHCQFTDDADKCEGPYCHDMAITIRGHLWATLAYSKERGNHLSAASSDRCYPFTTNFNSLNNQPPQRTSAQKTTPTTGNGKAVRAVAFSGPGGPFNAFWTGIINSIGKTTTLDELFGDATSGYCPPPTDDDNHGSGKYHGHDTINAGYAFVIMGETSISSLKSPLKVEETGHVEFTWWFWNQCPHVPAEQLQKWPHVRGGAMKLWFKEEDKGHPEHRY